MSYDRGNDLGMRVLQEHILISPNDVKFNNLYQRVIERVRVRKVKKDMQSMGCFDPTCKVSLNELFEIIDGQHRVVAAIELGFERIPASVISFPDKSAEATYFYLRNEHSSRQTPVNLLHSKFIAGEYIATLIYKLEKDPKSLFHSNIALKGVENTKNKLVVTQAFLFLATGAIGRPYSYQKAKDEFFISQFSPIGYDEIRERTNEFLSFFYGCFGSEKRSNPTPYKGNVSRAFCTFYAKLKRSGLIDSEKRKNEAISKMSSFTFTESFLKADHLGKVLSFVSHFNSKKRHRLGYDVSDIIDAADG